MENLLKQARLKSLAPKPSKRHPDYTDLAMDRRSSRSSSFCEQKEPKKL
jgi:hypothetical protein